MHTKKNLYIRILAMLLLFVGGVENEVWAVKYKVTYHILTKPINNEIYHMRSDFSGKRLEAVRVVDANATSETKIGLPEAFQSPLAENFKYYLSGSNVTESDAAVQMYDYKGTNKCYWYSIVDANEKINTDTYEISSNIDVYVTYDYKKDNTIYKLDGSKNYNLSISGGFLAFNRGRNNRIAIIPESANRVSAEDLVSEDFVKVNVSGIPGTSISDYWKDNKNPRANVAGQFHFMFQFVGEDPYNILIRTAYNKDYTYIEQHGDEKNLVYKYYKGSYLFWPSSDTSGFFLASDDHKQYTDKSTGYDPDPKDVSAEDKTGYFHGKGGDVVYNSFAILNNSEENGYLFMISRYVNKDGNISDPGDYKSAKYNFLARDGNYNNLKSESKKLSDASASSSTDRETYLVNSYVFKIKTKISGTELSEPVQVSEYYASSSPLDFVPDALKRKYVTFTGAYKQYEGENLVTEFNTFAEVDANAVIEDGKKVIWLDYETDMPFDTWTKAGGSDTDGDEAVDFDELKWYNFYVNKSASNSAYWDGSKIKTSTGLSKYARASHFAFVGDPYDLTIVGRKASEDVSGNPSTLNYMKLDATIGNNTAFNASGTTWGIMYDDNTGDYKDCFRLKDNSGEKYLHRNTTTDNPLNGTDNSDEAVRITVDNLPTKPYVYYIRDLGGNIAVKASGNHEPSAKLGYNTIPEIIRSPFIEGRTLTFYGSYTEAGGGATTAKSDATAGTPIITYAKDTEDGAEQHIVVRYDFPSEGNPYYTYIDGSTSFNVRLNGEYIYYDSGTNTIMSKASPTDDELGTNPYLWIDGGADPYAMTIKNVDANKYVTASATDKSALGWDADEADATKFVIKSGTSTGVYEVMYGTGESVDASTTYYNIGRDGTGTKMFQNTTYEHGYNQLRFQLTAQDAHQVTYHLIDKENKDLLQVVARHSTTDDPLFPTDYRSPLVAQYHYYTIDKFTDPNTSTTPVSGNASARYNLTTDTKLAKVGSETDIYVTYTANNLVDMSGRTTYLMKYAQGDQFRQEDGSDGLLAPMNEFTGDDAEKRYRYQAVYPYCNGDCNFFVYGQEQYDIQQQGAASTRTRWAWYVESVNNDPYHVKISSRQQETYPAESGNDCNAYFRTYAETYGGSNQIVTTLAWPGISGEQGTEYMVLGSAGQFRLVTSDPINDGTTTTRRAVNSFEQYWKTWNTIRKIVLDDKDAVARQSDPNTVPATPATAIATEAGKNNRTYLTDIMGWHSYENWAYAIRWNDYNKNGDKNKKGWENIEHWYQTINMGEGYFDFVKTVIDPVLILLDQHGWEVMRLPMPSSSDDPDKDEKYNAIRPYDSPMVKEYHFWTKTSKRMGFHQYYNLDQRVSVDGEPFSSTSLTILPPFDATNVHDTKGNLLDQYVTYTVKDEYQKACNVTLGYGEETTDPADKTKKYTPVIPTVTGVPFIIQQGSHFAYNNNNAATIEKYDVPTIGGMSQYIIDNVSSLTIDGSKKNELWYLVPNKNIDDEMGYANYGHAWASDYDRKDKVKTSGFNSWAFDPYNIQISSVANTSSYFVTNATEAEIVEGLVLGNGTTNALGARDSRSVSLIGGMDNRTLQITNATFMAVQDEDGNMQLMPRFDQKTRLKDFSELTTASGDNETHTKLYRPLVYNYRIIDNSGKESLRYQSGGDLVPQTPDWFKSPLAMDFEYYKDLTLEEGVYTEIKNETDISAKKITESLEGAAPTDNTVYVRYSYNAEADELSILQGKWLTIQLNVMDAKYDSGIKQGTSKPAQMDKDQKVWQWKLLKTPHSIPDPYAVQLFNRSVVGTEQPVADTRYAILSHTSGDYALAQAGLNSYTYKFLNGSGMTTSEAASLAEDKDGENPSGFTSTTGNFNGTDSQIKLINDVIHTFNYKIYTNNGDFAVSANQNDVSEDNSPILPEEIRSPLLNKDKFRYYEALADTAANSGMQIKNLYGLYDDIVYVRYNGYNLKTTEYKVPNVRNATSEPIVARDESSNDAALDIKGELLYNIFWHDDEIMKENDGSINSDSDKELQGGEAYVWKFEGNDPYAIKIKHKKSGKYVVGDDDLSGTATSTFMLLPSTDADWQYGVLQVTGTTGDAAQRLTDHGETLTANASTEPTKFIIFGLSTHTVIYHLLIANIGEKNTIPYRETKGGSETTKDINGSTQRDLTTTTTVTGDTYQLGETINGVNYCVAAGHITLGDPLKVPEALERPNCKYFYYVEGVYTNEDCNRSTHLATDLDNQYRGLQITQMGTEPELLGKTVRINVEYQFDDGLPTNNGSDFVTNTSGTQWFTFETNDETPYLANYTYKDAKLLGILGRIGHYTNEFLWSPVGDPYGFKMYNRYVYKNGTESGHTNKVMTTESAPAANAYIIMAEDSDPDRPVYELLPGETAGYFKVQTLTIPESGTPYYLDNTSGEIKLKTSTTTEWTFGLDQSLFDPYYLGAGNVGGLTTTVKEGTLKEKSGKTLYEEATTLIAKQGVVFDADNIVDFTPGYYRIFNQPNSQGVKIPRYLSGYTHKTELDVNHDGNEADAIPMHFYEKEGVETTFEVLGSGFTRTAATQGQIPIEAPEYDPASIFYISGSGPYTMQTQGLYVKDNKMTATSGNASSFYVIDIGGAVVLLHDGAEPANRKYLHYKQNSDIYDVKFEEGSVIGDDDAAKWCMEPANKKGLWIKTHSGGEEETLTNLWYYSSYCVPFDLLIANKNDDEAHSSNAYTCVSSESPWPATESEARIGLHPKPIGKYNTGTYKDNDYFVPAGTPVLFSTKRATEYIKATIPTTIPSSSISTIFSYKYLEQVLPDWDNSKRVYVFGPKMEGTLSINTSDGTVNATLPSLGNTNVGFHLNANPNKEAGLTIASWTRNNYYVLHNKIYYQVSVSPGVKRLGDIKSAPQFVPVIFDYEEEGGELQPDGQIQQQYDGDVYDLSGRKVATEEQVNDGTWKQILRPGIYIVGGKKIKI